MGMPIFCHTEMSERVTRAVDSRQKRQKKRRDMHTRIARERVPTCVDAGSRCETVQIERGAKFWTNNDGAHRARVWPVRGFRPSALRARDRRPPTWLREMLP